MTILATLLLAASTCTASASPESYLHHAEAYCRYDVYESVHVEVKISEQTVSMDLGLSEKGLIMYRTDRQKPWDAFILITTKYGLAGIKLTVRFLEGDIVIGKCYGILEEKRSVCKSVEDSSPSLVKQVSRLPD